MCCKGAPCSQLGEYIRASLSTFFPMLENMPVPSPRTCAKWRVGLLVLSDLVSAWKMTMSETLTIHHDGTTKWQQKYGASPVNTDFGHVMPGGVYVLQDGTAQEGASMILKAALHVPQAVLDSARAFFEAINPAPPSSPTRPSSRTSISNTDSYAEHILPWWQTDSINTRAIRECFGCCSRCVPGQ